MSSNNDRNGDDQTSDQTPTTDVTEDYSAQDESGPLADRDTQTDGTRQAPTADETLSLNDWEELKPNPEPGPDLGYRVDDWEQFETSDTSNQIIYLPSDESLIKEDAFIVAQETILCDLGEHY